MSWNLKLDQNWFQKSPNFHQIVTKCVKNDPKMFQKCSQNVLKMFPKFCKMFQKCFKIVPKSFQNVSKCFLRISVRCGFIFFLVTFWPRLGNILETFWKHFETCWKHFGNILERFWEHFEHILGFFGEFEVFWWKFGDFWQNFGTFWRGGFDRAASPSTIKWIIDRRWRRGICV